MRASPFEVSEYYVVIPKHKVRDILVKQLEPLKQQSQCVSLWGTSASILSIAFALAPYFLSTTIDHGLRILSLFCSLFFLMIFLYCAILAVRSWWQERHRPSITRVCDNILLELDVPDPDVVVLARSVTIVHLD